MESYSLFLNERRKWNELIKASEHNDIFFLPEYLEPFEKHLKARCILFYYGNDDDHILFPFFLRDLSSDVNDDPDDNNNLKDAISPWYYGGALLHGTMTSILKEGFAIAMKDFLKENNCISFFSRSNPYRNNHSVIGSGMAERKLGHMVYIDLERDIDDLWKHSLNDSARNAIKKDRRSGFEIIMDNSDKYYSEFIKNYNLEMERFKAKPFYRFSNDFFNDLKEGLGKNLILTTKLMDGIWTAGSIEIYYDSVMYGFLGTRDFRNPKLSSTHGLIWNMVEYGKENGIKKYDLGGGHECSGLMQFKKSFSKNIIELWGNSEVIDRARYKKACIERGIKDDMILYEDSQYFPEYRRYE